MPKFRIEMELTSINERLLLTDFDSNNDSSTGITFNEDLNESENDRYTLNFSIAEKIGRNKEINVGSLISIGRPIRLYLYNPNRMIRMVISSFAPVIGPENLIYNVEAQDYASYVFSKNNAGLNLDTFQDEDFLEWLELIEEQDTTITNIGNYILERGWLRLREYNTVSEEFDFSGWSVNVTGTNKILNVEVSDSNTYNALIELANIANSNILFNYENETITLIDKEHSSLDKNYTLKRDFNLQDYSISYTGDNLYSIFYVEGAADEFGLFTILSDETDYKDNFLFNFNYFKDRNLVSESDYNTIVSQINNNLKEINIKFQRAIKERFTRIGEINDIWNRINNLAEILAAPESYETYGQTYLDLNSQFSRPSLGTQQVTVTENVTVLNVLWTDLPQNATGTVSYPIIFSYLGQQFTASNNNPISLPLGLQVEIFLTAGAGRVPVSSGNFTIYVQGTNAANADFDITRFNVVSAAVQFNISRPNQSQFTFISPLFDLLNNFDGTNAINKQLASVDTIIQQIEGFQTEDTNEIACIVGYPSGGYSSGDPCAVFNISDNAVEREARQTFLESRLEDYKAGIGETLQEGGLRPGKFTLIKERFEHFLNLYSEPVPSKTIMDIYRESDLAKKEFWYNLKKDRQHIFPEGYYQNEFETNVGSLKAQAEVIYSEHQKPQENFSITYINISDIIGKNLEDIRIGDFVLLREAQLAVQQNEQSKLKVASISRSLRDKANISLTIYRYNLINNMLEKIIANNQN